MFHSSFCISSATIQKPHLPYHCIWNIVCKAFGPILSLFGCFFPVFSKCFTAVLHFIATMQSRTFRTTAFGKLSVKPFGHILLLFGYFFQCLASASQQLCIHRTRFKSRTFRTTAFGKLSVKPFGQSLFFFWLFLAVFSKCFTAVFCMSSATIQKPHLPYHCIWNIVCKAFRTNSFSFWLFLPVFSKCFTAVLHVIGHDSKAAQCVPLTTEKLHLAAAKPGICSFNA